MQDIITIDGPAGSGKGTLAKRLANHFGFEVVDSGLYYRAVASIVREVEGKDPVSVAKELKLEDLQRSDVRDPALSRLVPSFSEILEVRQAVNRLILSAIPPGSGCVIDGRAGALEFPQARAKIYLAATEEVRAKRRFDELVRAGKSVSLETVLADQQERDRRDKERKVAPLDIYPGVFVLESTLLDADEVFDAARRYCELVFGELEI